MRAPLLLLPLLTACEAGRVAIDAVDTETVDTDGANQAPGAPEVSISPAAPGSGDGLHASLVFEATDPDGDALTYAWAWLVDGTPRPGLTGPDVPPAETARGQTWQVVVRASDGRAEGPSARDEVTIGNGAPVVRLAWADATPHHDVDLVVDSTIDDPDGDPLDVAWSWTVDGASAPFTGDTVSSASTLTGQTWRVHVSASDGEATTEAHLVVTVVNRPPVLSNLEFTPDPAHPSRALAVTFLAGDPDIHPLEFTYAWTRDGQPTPYTTALVPSTALSPGETWAVTVTADDLHGGVASATDTVQVENQVPEVQSLELHPDPPGDGDDLVAVLRANDADGDALTTTYTWYRNGTPFRTGPSPTVAAASTSLDDVWQVQAVVSDAWQASPPFDSRAVTVIDRPPIAPGVALKPEVPTGCAPLVCRLTTPATDPDDTVVTVAFTWTKDGAPYAGPTQRTTWAGDTIPEAELTPGSTFTCRVVASSGGEQSSPATATATVLEPGEVVDAFPVPGRGTADLLLVIDDSCSMSDEQAALGDAADALIGELTRTALDWQIGVVTTDMDAPTRSGRLVELPDGRTWVDPSAADPVADLDALVQVGVGGHFDESGLQAAVTALSPSLLSGPNAGFLRAGSALGVLFLTDEPDFSDLTEAEFVDAMLALRDADDLFVWGLLDLPDAPCPTSFGIGVEYARVIDALDGRYARICTFPYDAFLHAFAGEVAGVPRRFLPTVPPDPDTLAVTLVRGASRVALLEDDDWTWDEETGEVTLAQSPPVGALVELVYESACTP